jgi:hypothetical protein
MFKIIFIVQEYVHILSRIRNRIWKFLKVKWDLDPKLKGKSDSNKAGMQQNKGGSPQEPFIFTVRV